MSWRDWFKSAHTVWLEREIEQLKKAHAQELSYVRTDNDKLRDELQRTRMLITPGLQGISLPHEEHDAPPEVSNVPTGTPWQRIKARMWDEELARVRKEAEAAKEKAHGVSGQNGKDASQREPS